MSQFPQGQFPQQTQYAMQGQPFQQQGQFPMQGQQFQPQGQFGGQPATQGQYQQPQQFQQPQRAQMPQLQRVPKGQGYAPGQFPHENTFTVVGQVFPNQWMPTGIEFKPSDKGGQVSVNIKVRNAWGQNPNQVKIQFLRAVAFGQIAGQIANGFRAGQIVRITGEFRPNKYKSSQTGKINSVNQIILSNRQGVTPITLIGELPMFEEYDADDHFGGQSGNVAQPQGQYRPEANGNVAPGYQQQAQYQQPAQQFAAPQQQFQQAPQGQFPPQQQPQFSQQGQFPQQAPGQVAQQQPVQQFTGQPQGQFQAVPDQTHQATGVPQQPAPGQMTGNFAPPTQPQQGPPQGFPAGNQPPPF